MSYTPPPRAQRELRRVSSGTPWIRPRSGKPRLSASSAAARPAPATAGSQPAKEGPPLLEWHHMTPGQWYTAWAHLRAWVTWLCDQYELLVEDKLPMCWAMHPGLVQELWALRAWRLEIYNGQPGGGQAACYWHSTLLTVLNAAKTRYAPGCRAGHRGAPHAVSSDAEVQRRWAEADPRATIPPADLAAGEARQRGTWTSPEQMASAFDAGEAADLLGVEGHLMYRGGWWAPASSGWYETPSPPLSDQEPGEDPWQRFDDSSEEGGDGPWSR